jgi:hypothetical protein
VTFFCRNSEDFSWKRIIGVNSLPRGASVRDLGKNLSPSEHRSGRIREYVHECVSKWKILFHTKEKFMEDTLINFTRFVNFLLLCDVIAGLALVRKSVVCFRMIGVWRNSGHQELANFGNLEESQFGNCDR